MTGPANAQTIDQSDQFGTELKDAVEALTVDQAGNVYAVGLTDGTLPGEQSAGGADAFVRKYSGSGQVVFTRQFGTAGTDEGEGVAVDGSENVYVTGATTGSLPGEIGAGGTDAFVRKYSATGQLQWTHQFGTPQNDSADGVAIDNSGNLYLAGFTAGALPGETSAGGRDAFLRKYSPTGQLLFTRQFGTSGHDQALGEPIDASGNIYVAGFTDGTLPGQRNSGGRDAFLRKYDTGGTELWTRQFGSTGSDEARNVVVGSDGVFAGGFTYGSLPGQSSAGNQDAFVTRFTAVGELVFTRQFGTSANDEAEAAGTDAAGNGYFAGATSGTLPGQTSAGKRDAYVRGYSPAGSEVLTRQFGSAAADEGDGLAVDSSSGAIHVGGLAGAALPGETHFGGFDGYLVRVVSSGEPPPPATDLVADLKDSADPVPVGTVFSYMATARNKGPEAATSVTLSVGLPSSTYVSYGPITPSQGTCSRSGRKVSCQLGPVGVSGQATVNIEVTPKVEDVLSARAEVSGAETDPVSTNNADGERTTVN